MCNHLAEHVLDIDMLHLMKQFQASFTGDARNYLQGTIELLTQTSHIVSGINIQFMMKVTSG
jgi:hypothetical protein